MTTTYLHEDAAMTSLRLTLTHTHFHVTPDELAVVLAALPPRACYMRAYASGCYRVSGADLQGKAKRYGAAYHYSRSRVHAIATSVLGESLVSVTGYRSAKSVWSMSALGREVGA